ncbi:MAG: IS1595 family transposase [Bacillota bacterium]
MAKQEAISFMEFKNKFNSEDVCRVHLFKMHWSDGFKRLKSGNETYYVISTRNRYECTACHYQASVTAGTVMEKTHIKLEKWFWAIYFVGRDKRGCSAMKDRDSQYLAKNKVY